MRKERQIIEKPGVQILRIHGEEAHPGSRAATYAFRKVSGDGMIAGLFLGLIVVVHITCRGSRKAVSQ